MSKIGEGVHDGYKQRAAAGGDVLWHVTIKGQNELAPGIPLHMSLKVFDDNKDMDVEEIKRKVEQFDIRPPKPEKLDFKTTIFTSKKDGKDYYMLLVTGTDQAYKEFYDNMKHCGTVYDKFMPHITIDKGLYEKINSEGIKPEEVMFGNLCIERGAGNTIHAFNKSEDLEKSVFRNMGTAAAMTAGLAMAPAAHAPAPTASPQASTQQASPYSSKRMLSAIAQVESSGGKDTKHGVGGGPIHGAEHAYGKYGLMPETIRETIHMNRDLASKHGKAAKLKGNDLFHYMHDNPGLEDAIAQKHLGRLEHHFGQNPTNIGYAWLEGVAGTYHALKSKKDIANHWHVKKVNDAYSKVK
jgi:hypothetical protein